MSMRAIAVIVAVAVLFAAALGGAGYYLASSTSGRTLEAMPKTARVCWPPWNSATVAVSETAAPGEAELQGETAPPNWERAFDEIASQVAEIRGLEFKVPVRRAVMSKEQMEDRIRSLASRESRNDSFERAEDALKYLGLVAPGNDLAEEIGEAYGEQVAGYYDDEAETLVVRTDLGTPSSPVTRFVIAHELVHALDDQHFDLHTMQEKAKDAGHSEDAAALSALIEGVAVVASLEYLRRFMRVQIPDPAFDQLESAMLGEQLEALPLYIRKHMTFPYIEGGKFVDEHQRSGGWDSINNLYRDPPRSTAEIMHAASYRSSRLVSVVPSVGPVTETIEGMRDERWYLVGEGTMGELDLSLMLESAEITNVAAAADGWRGDAFRHVGCLERRLFIARFEMASDGDASELADAIGVWATRWELRGAGTARAAAVNHSHLSVTMVLADDQEVANRVAAAEK